MTKNTPRKLGGARRVIKTAEAEDDEIIDEETTPTVQSVKNYEFQAPQFHDFQGQQDTEENTSAWFEEQHESPNEQRNFAVNLLKMPSPTAELKESQNMLRMRSPSGGVQVNIDLTIQKKTRASAQSRGMTIPKPFNLATAVKKAIQSGEMEPKSPFVPLAQKIRTFETATPERFKTKPKASKRIAQMQKLTQPQSPMLSTKLRSQHRANEEMMSTEQRQEQEMKMMGTFKAKPVNKRILEAREEMISLGKSALTVPMSPAIQKRKPREAPRPLSPTMIKANPAPDSSKAFKPSLDSRMIPVSEFTLPGDSIHEQNQKDLQSKTEMDLQDSIRQREFKANPLIASEKFAVDYSTKITEQAPFQLLTNVRGEMHQKVMKEQLEKNEQAALDAKQFHANPLPSSDHFIPARSNKPLTEIQEFTSYSELRMEDRKVYEEDQSRRMQEEEETKKVFDAEQEIQDKKDLQRLRKEKVHKAQPVRSYTGIEVKPSERQLTMPKTPGFVRARNLRTAANKQ